MKSQITTLTECRQCFSEPSQAVLNASSCHFYFWATAEKDVLYQRLFRPGFMGDLLLMQFNSIVNMIYGDVSYL